MQRDIRAGLFGGLAGAIATVPMSLLMLGALQRGYLRELPPRLMSSVALGRAGKHDPDQIVEDAVAAELHVDIGVVSGALFGVLTSRLQLPVHRVLQGTIFGLLVWAVAYVGVLPGLKVMPPPRRDNPGRPPVMILAHIVYGTTLGWLVNRWMR